MEEHNAVNQAKKIVWKAERKRLRREARKKKLERVVHDTAHWVVTHADEIAVLTPVCVCGARILTGVVRDARRSANLRKEKDLRELYCYDRSLGHYWELRRKLTNREWVEVDKRKRSGEKLGDILKGMNVLR